MGSEASDPVKMLGRAEARERSEGIHALLARLSPYDGARREVDVAMRDLEELVASHNELVEANEALVAMGGFFGFGGVFAAEEMARREGPFVARVEEYEAMFEKVIGGVLKGFVDSGMLVAGNPTVEVDLGLPPEVEDGDG